MSTFTRIYTRTGDDGTTGLTRGRRVPKDSRRVDAFGTLDELSSAIGVVRAELGQIAPSGKSRRLDAWLAWIQDLLFNLGSELATLPSDRQPGMPELHDEDVITLEHAIDEAQADLQPLAHFIHPGGSTCGAFLHLARTICRRAERLFVSLAKEEPLPELNIRWINRLSDALFVWARWINAELKQPETQWNTKTLPPSIP